MEEEDACGLVEGEAGVRWCASATNLGDSVPVLREIGRWVNLFLSQAIGNGRV